jgi:hypothetical protein
MGETHLDLHNLGTGVVTHSPGKLRAGCVAYSDCILCAEVPHSPYNAGGEEGCTALSYRTYRPGVQPQLALHWHTGDPALPAPAPW